MELTDLTKLGTLNLSMNHLTGQIPSSTGNFEWIETLHISRNQISGPIPLSMTSLTFLNHLNLSYNNLSGKIPTTNQFLTLDDPSIYQGNAGSVYTGVDFCKKLCGSSIVRSTMACAIPAFLVYCVSGESMESASRACCEGIKIGKILIHRDGDNGKKLIYEKLPKDISERHVLLLDPFLATGNSANQAIELLIQKGVPESHIIFLNLISAPEGIHCVCKRFPSLKIVTSEIDVALNEEFRVIPGMGEFGDRYFEYWWTYMRADSEVLDEVRRLSEAGKIKIPVEKTFPIAQLEIQEAKEKLDGKDSDYEAVISYKLSMAKKVFSQEKDMILNSNLVKLDLNNSHFHGEIPDAISNLAFLEKLDLLGIHWGKLSRNLGKLCNLELYDSKISGEIVDYFDSLSECFSSRLETLDLGDNGVMGKLPNSLGYIKSLRFL
ncbi:hypothetical protein FEM48_Zijuj09G0216700 [Ziziphus jujuba var. spinosa]|uniref:uracil phosphoribosyltransferase n=1 Tax=Ziziphus jujuba var. spinosa TaxID=714518 RepID=A0A978UVG7_ZIZJJ|nr:hypothetical protein FEM48_Zijuj09G0216700 [Ziziphus jujuba var. spinosa]